MRPALLAIGGSGALAASHTHGHTYPRPLPPSLVAKSARMAIVGSSIVAITRSARSMSIGGGRLSAVHISSPRRIDGILCATSMLHLPSSRVLLSQMSIPHLSGVSPAWDVYTDDRNLAYQHEDVFVEGRGVVLGVFWTFLQLVSSESADINAQWRRGREFCLRFFHVRILEISDGALNA
ncbi:hypothetical protein HGRIS_008459 [Hohenbuehelia grisea]|uniref:Uncharacterized protein n=1 Tax=Hohenbuehelia grisea TaxID=104357 RepID=A0ABR3J924_9AGAR